MFCFFLTNFQFAGAKSISGQYVLKPKAAGSEDFTSHGED